MQFFWKFFGALVLFASMTAPLHAQVIGGRATTIEEHPWLVALYVSKGGVQRFCGGSKIGDGWVLTAAHCFVDADTPYRARVKSGVSRLAEPRAVVPIRKVLMHPAFDATTFANDIALVRVDVRKAEPIRLPRADEIVPDHEMLTIAGWGITETGQMAEVLQEAWVPHVPANICNARDSYDGAIGSNMMCAGFPWGGVDACAGDSGGPLVWHGANGPVLVGVVSFGRGCGEAKKFGVYTRVRKYLDWIESIVGGRGGG